MKQDQHANTIVLLHQMLFEMARGNFTMRIPQIRRGDDLDSLVVLVNMVAEELQESVFHFGYINPRNTYRFLTQAMIILDQNAKVLVLSSSVDHYFGYGLDALSGRFLNDFLDKDSKLRLLETLDELDSGSISQLGLSLNFIPPNGLVMRCDCMLVKFASRLEYVLSFIVPTVDKPLMEEDRDGGTAVKRPSRRSDAVVIQQLYDYILANLEEPLPSIKALARQFGTNEFKIKDGFRYFFKTSIYKFYTEERLKRAHLMICQSELPLKQIALMSGFSNYPNFSKAFKKHFGFAPNTLRRRGV